MNSKLTLLAIAALSLQGCSTSQAVSFQSEGKARVRALDWNNLNGEGKVLGQTPLTVRLGDVNDKVLRIEEDKKIPQNWIVTCDSRRKLVTAKIKLDDLAVACAGLKEEKKEPPPKELSPARLNRTHRLVLKAYEQLVSGNTAVASDLAAQVAKEAPELAAPHLIIGLAYLRVGRRQEANQSFQKAALLDPEDSGIAELIKRTRN